MFYYATQMNEMNEMVHVIKKINNYHEVVLSPAVGGARALAVAPVCHQRQRRRRGGEDQVGVEDEGSSGRRSDERGGSSGAVLPKSTMPHPLVEAGSV